MNRYQPNNIIFRIAASDAIGKFKSLQAQSFVQLARRELNFNTSAREVVLLEYDHFSQWLFRIERICVAAQEGPMSQALHSAIHESFREEIRTIETILATHPEVFSSDIVDFMKVIHGYSLSIIDRQMNDGTYETIERTFNRIVNVVSDYLQHVLTCLHELNSNIITRVRNPFICISDFLLKGCTGDDCLSPLLKRIQYFQSVGCGDEYVLKTYSNEDVFERACDYLKNSGVKLVNEAFERPVRALA